MGEGQLATANARILHVRNTGGSFLDLSRLELTDADFEALLPKALDMALVTGLDVFGNQLTAVPDTLGNLTSLTTLRLSGNQLTAVPDTLGNLTSLTTLDLDRNQLTAIPDTLGNLTSLTTLYLFGNQLTAVPDTLGNLTSLTTLDLSGNQLTAVPDTLGNLTSLTQLDLDRNPLPPELLAAASDGLPELLLFLQELDSDGVDLAEAKLVLVGEGEVGKSSLLGALRGDPWDPDRLQTHGMQIKPLPVRCHAVSLTLNAWDFGGQKSYRPTHQIFFTAPAVYVVVWKPRPGPEQGNVEHWLSVIRHRAGKDAKVLVVASHGGPDSRASAIDEASLRKRFGEMIVGFHNIDSQTPDERLEALRTAIAETAATLPHVRRRYPASWLRAFQALRDTGQPTMGYNEYLSFAASLGLSPTRARSLAVNAHSLGTWIFYSDEDALAELVVLQPEWLSVAIARVLDDETAVDARGLVSHRRLGEVWSQPDPVSGVTYTSAQQRLFLRLMERFELTYRVPGVVHGEKTSLVAQLVPADQPDLAMVWDGFRPDAATTGEMCQAIEKGDDRDRVVVPEGLIYRLIVRLHHQRIATSQAPQGTHWQRGLLTESRYGARALLTVTDKGVEVKARGPAAAAYLEQVVDAVRDCFEFWPGLTTRAMATCGQSCGLGSPGRGLFNVRKLLAAQERDVRDVSCPEDDCDAYLSVADLLGGGAPAPTPDHSEQILAAVHDVRARLRSLEDEEKAALGRIDARLSGYIRSVDDDAVNGPRLFTLEPLDRSLRHPGWTKTRMRLTLFCEHSRQPVHVLDPGHPTAGVYEVEVPREWWVKAAPILKTTAALLKPVIGIGLADLELTFTEAQWTAVEEQVTVARESVDAAIEAAGALTAEDGSEGLGQNVPHDRGLVAAEGGVLRSLHGLLAAQDITYADLRKVRDTDGRLLWVHPRFVTIYQPPPPQIPDGSP